MAAKNWLCWQMQLSPGHLAFDCTILSIPCTLKHPLYLPTPPFFLAISLFLDLGQQLVTWGQNMWDIWWLSAQATWAWLSQKVPEQPWSYWKMIVFRSNPAHSVPFIIHWKQVDGPTQLVYQKIDFAFLLLLKKKKKAESLLFTFLSYSSISSGCKIHFAYNL